MEKDPVLKTPQLLIDAEKLLAENDVAGLQRLKRNFLQDFVLEKFPYTGFSGPGEAQQMLELLEKEKGGLFNRISDIHFGQFPNMPRSHISFVVPEVALMQFVNGIEVGDIHQLAINNIDFLNREMYNDPESASPSRIADRRYWGRIEDISRKGMRLEDASVKIVMPNNLKKELQ